MSNSPITPASPPDPRPAATLSPGQHLDALVNTLRDGPVARDTTAWNNLQNAIAAIRATLGAFPGVL
jgi:hypothetical protein